MKKKFAYFFSVAFVHILSFPGLYAQKECGTVLRESEKTQYSSSVSAAIQMRKQQKTTASHYYIRVFIHNFVSDDATDSAWSYNEIISEFDTASSIFNQYNMCLVLMGIDYPRNTTFKDSFNTANFSSLLPLGHSIALDVTLHKKLDDATGSLNGSAYSTPSKWLSLSRGAIAQRSFAHEVGHCLGLSHTFETLFCLECPDGSNSLTCGDKTPDTRATPDADSALAANTNASCIYSGNLSIMCGPNQQTYNPEIINMMSYGRRLCRRVFTPTQLFIMTFTLDNVVGFQEIWFDEPPPFILIAEPIGALIINTDSYYAGGSIQIGNNNALFNVLIGGNNTQQKIISPSLIRITPGVKLMTPSGERGRIRIRAAPYCQE